MIPPIERPTPTNDLMPAFDLNGQLYKTTDGGATWHLLRKDLIYISQVQLAYNNPQIIYVGGAIFPRPLITTQPYSSDYSPNQAGFPTYPVLASGFQLSMSKDGGATWRNIAVPSSAWGIRTWFVSPDGQVYVSTLAAYNGPTSSGGGAPGAQSTAIVSTAEATKVSGKSAFMPPQNAISAPSRNTNQVPSTGGAPAATAVVPTAPAQSSTIQRYDPTTGKWSLITNPPAGGLLVAVTPSGTNGGVALWFLGLSNNGNILYRYITA
jgi:hypothetical protein